MSTKLSRRTLLAGAAAATGGAAGLAVPSPAAAVADSSGACLPAAPSVVVPPSDQRYADLVRSWNGRFVGSPDYVQVVNTTAQVEQAVQAAVRARKQIAVRSGGHCVEGFVTDPSIKVQIDMSRMTEIAFDRSRNAFLIEPGATLREVFRKLYTEYAVTVPAGTCPSVGAGGHFQGGGFGALCRRNGLSSDCIYAVEVVTVTASGGVKTIVATREAGDPNRELWWAHTGGGGGNFGVVTKYWMRGWGATGSNPATLLPAPPRMNRSLAFVFPWAALTPATFTQLLRNYIGWHLANSGPASPFTALNATLIAAHKNSFPANLLSVVVDPTDPATNDLVAQFKAAVVDPVGAPYQLTDSTRPWLESTNVAGYSDTGDEVGRRNKAKGTYLRGPYSDEQLATIHHYLTATDITSPLAGVFFNSYGGKVNSLPWDATAVPQRDSVLKVMHTAHWTNPAQDATFIGWLRDFYRDLYAGTGGVPVPNAVTDGSYINYADIDLADPALNTSGVPWSTLYYKGSYPRLQRVKAAYDPGNVFRHKLSIELP
jgi:hypothetical protein